MRKDLVIVGAGNVGGFLSYNISDFGDFNVLGFLDDDPSKVGREIFGRQVLGTVDAIGELAASYDLSAVVGIASPRSKKAVADRLSKYPVQYPNFIASRVWVSKEVVIGKGIILYPGVSINYGSQLEDFVTMNMNCAIGHDCTISAFSTLAPGVNLAGFTHVEEGADIGIGVSTRQKVRIGRYATIGGQTMLTKDAPSEALVIGIPGQQVK